MYFYCFDSILFLLLSKLRGGERDRAKAQMFNILKFKNNKYGFNLSILVIEKAKLLKHFV
jgi:hypothetical protein